MKPTEKPAPQRVELEDSYRLMVESVVDYAIFLLNEDGTVLTWNKGAERIKGYTAKEIIGKHFSTFYTAEDRKNGKPKKMLDRARQDGRVEDTSWRLRKDGTKFWGDVVITALIDDEGNLRGFGKVTRDLSERHEAEQKLISAYKHLEKML